MSVLCCYFVPVLLVSFVRTNILQTGYRLNVCMKFAREKDYYPLSNPGLKHGGKGDSLGITRDTIYGHTIDWTQKMS